MANKETKTKKENKKNKKSFFKDFKAELKKVSWPTPKQLLNNTIAVITIVIATAVIVFVLDVVFEILNKQGIEKIKEVIITENTTVEDNKQEEQSTETETVEENTEASQEEQEVTENNTENKAEE